ncbi:MAG: hypothetical protein OEV74_02875 [Cyclobacteriaceae bacterium]|nr:hypothetical protein [Cyclobacteriaceae bacterium]MDH4295198.1 hypothetical protein [Cyclobacteriaceae bacterium]MDH5248912.1 hypothetical protein [Cyclobacteriaceae bacterium]
MKKLEEIPKKEVFNVPEGYFDKLPGIIQARVTAPDKRIFIRPAFSFTLRYALPVIVIFTLGIFWFVRQGETATAESILATIETEDLVAYLYSSDLTTDELLDNVSLDTYDANKIEEAVFALDLNTDKKYEEILDEIDLNNL